MSEDVQMKSPSLLGKRSAAEVSNVDALNSEKNEQISHHIADEASKRIKNNENDSPTLNLINVEANSSVQNSISVNLPVHAVVDNGDATHYSESKIPIRQISDEVQAEDVGIMITPSTDEPTKVEEQTATARDAEAPEEKDNVQAIDMEEEQDYEEEKTTSSEHRNISYFKVIMCFSLLFVFNTLATIFLLDMFLKPVSVLVQRHRRHPHIIPPSHASYSSKKWKRNRSAINEGHDFDKLSNVTLREFLSHDDGFHLGLAPAFFGFYVYFGALTAFRENVLHSSAINEGNFLLPVDISKVQQINEEIDGNIPTEPLLKSVAGASAGAMAAVLLASGLDPRQSAEFASSMTIDKFWDFPGFGGMIKGDLFEEIMISRLKRSGLTLSQDNEREIHHLSDEEVQALEKVNLEHGLIPVAVSGFDVLNLEGKILTEGCMGKAARASATFPGLFQPCKWLNRGSTGDDSSHHYLIDGGVTDGLGLAGLSELRKNEKNKRVVNLVAGNFGIGGPAGPRDLPDGLHAKEVVSISIENTPQCGPWAMSNGPKAVEAARKAVISVLDQPMYMLEDGHFILHIDASEFVDQAKL